MLQQQQQGYCFNAMLRCDAFGRAHHEGPSRPWLRRGPVRGRMAGAWWLVVLLWCGLLVSTHRGAVVRADFTANPLVLNSDNAILLNGIVSGDRSGVSTSGVGDMNGDGIDDFVVGAYFASLFGSVETGQAYLVFGRNASTQWAPNPFELSTLDGTNGVTLNGLVVEDHVGWSVAGVRDVNGDGCNDMLIGTLQGHVAYLVFGVNGTWPAAVNLTQGAFDGVKIVGQPSSSMGESVASAGDVNKDGIPDIAVGGRFEGGNGLGRMYVLYGRDANSPWPEQVSLMSYVNASTGFFVQGETISDNCGAQVSGVGDVNDDGVHDVAVACWGYDAPGLSDAGIVAVVFGSSDGIPVEIAPSQLNGTNGFVVYGQGAFDKIGRALARVRDVNGDGIDDFAMGAPFADGSGTTANGEMYVVFGRGVGVSPWPAEVNVSSLDGHNGFVLVETELNGFLGIDVSPAGDVNADGIDDLMVSASQGGASDRGRVFVLYGRTEWFARRNTSELQDTLSTTFEGGVNNDRCGDSVSLVGDVNGDGRGDFVIGCAVADPDTGGRENAGQTAIVFGPLFTAAPTTASPTAAPTTGSPTTTPTTSPTTASPTAALVTASPTPSTCATQGAFIPPGATCVNGMLVTSTNTTAPAGTTSTVTTSVTVTGGASFEQPSGSTLVFVAGSGGGGGGGGGSSSTSIVVEDGGCASIGGDAVVTFETDPSNGGEAENTGALVLVTADCVMGAFGSVSGTTSFEGDECVAIGDGEQDVSGNSISVSFGVSNTCGSKSGLSSVALIGIIVGASVVAVAIVIVVVKLSIRARNRRAEADVKMSRMRYRPG